MSKLLALDQSSLITGWAVFDNNKIQEYGKISLSSGTPVEKRLIQIKQQVSELIDKFKIDEVVLEDIQMQANVVNNVVTFKTLAWVQSVILVLCAERGIPATLVLASSWKHTLGIKGANRAAQKKNAQEYVLNNYSIKTIQDTVDAICIGLHYIKQNSEEKGISWAN